jgi:hypothetical protein
LGIISVDFDTKGSTIDHIFCISQILGKNGNTVKRCINCIGFKKAYESVRREVLYDHIFVFAIHMKLIRLIKMCLNETYSRARVGKHLSDVFALRNVLKQGDALSPMLFSFAVERAVKSVQMDDNIKVDL